MVLPVNPKSLVPWSNLTLQTVRSPWQLQAVRSPALAWGARGWRQWSQYLPSNLLAFLLLVAMPGAPSSVLAPSSKARNPYYLLVPDSNGLQPTSHFNSQVDERALQRKEFSFQRHWGPQVGGTGRNMFGPFCEYLSTICYGPSWNEWPT